MKVVCIIGSSAVGKMTVGQELMKITDLRLFHNHMTIEPVIEIFGYFDAQVISRLREVIFEEFAKSNNYGLIFTFMWAFDQIADWQYIRHVQEIFGESAEFYFVELVASQEVRLQRNQTENRLRNKPTKRDVECSNQRLLQDDETYRFVSYENELPFEHYLRIDNTNLEASEVARQIKETFSL